MTFYLLILENRLGVCRLSRLAMLARPASPPLLVLDSSEMTLAISRHDLLTNALLWWMPPPAAANNA